MTTITIPTILLDTEQPLQQLAISAVIKGAQPYYSATETFYPIEATFLALDQAKALTGYPDVTIENYPLMIEIASEDDLVPEDLFGAFRVPEGEEDPVNITWAEWMRSNYTVIERDGRKFINASANTSNNPELTSLEAVYSSLIKPSDLPKESES
jgi:hypothetical protein